MSSIDTISSFAISTSKQKKRNMLGKKYMEFSFNIRIETTAGGIYNVNVGIFKNEQLYMMIMENNCLRSLMLSIFNGKDGNKLHCYTNKNDFLDGSELLNTNLDEINKYYQKYIGAQILKTDTNTREYKFQESHTKPFFKIPIHHRYYDQHYYTYQIETDRGILTFVPQHYHGCGWGSISHIYVRGGFPTFIVQENDAVVFEKTISINCSSHSDTPDGYYKLDSDWMKKNIEETIERIKSGINEIDQYDE